MENGSSRNFPEWKRVTFCPSPMLKICLLKTQHVENLSLLHFKKCHPFNTIFIWYEMCHFLQPLPRVEVLVFSSCPPGLPALWNIPLNLTPPRPLNIFSTPPKGNQSEYIPTRYHMKYMYWPCTLKSYPPIKHFLNTSMHCTTEVCQFQCQCYNLHLRILISDCETPLLLLENQVKSV